MKKLLLLVAVFFAAFANAQSDIQKKKADLFASEAITHFKLNESKKASIAEAKLGLMMAQKEMEEKKKSGVLAEADVAEYRKKNLLPHTQKLMDIIGVKWPEIDEFNKVVNPKLNTVKL
jgi:uncharacterized protein (DUF1015 family)